MALPETRYQFRTSLFDGERSLEAKSIVIALLHPSELPERLWLRMIAWALWYTPTLRFGPGLSEPDEPALFDVDLTARTTVWIAVDPPNLEKLSHAVRHNRGARIGAAFSGEAQLAGCIERSRSARHLEDLEVVVVDPALLVRLASELPERRYDASITVIDDHLYMEIGGKPFEGTFRRFRGIDPASV